MVVRYRKWERDQLGPKRKWESDGYLGRKSSTRVAATWQQGGQRESRRCGQQATVCTV